MDGDDVHTGRELMTDFLFHIHGVVCLNQVEIERFLQQMRDEAFVEIRLPS